ncbi:glycosyltransferase involved in cell wall biosynthesis [Paenibacillus shirakamiensis]|uniref:Glycosyltransferase involved in cell wall biosynthesis n=1 Tax=Paenibacillus shirakamiensis TaxID=1265935 RepID=A0ABS4JJT9_9BACL|nr:glycosyltransferase involved in cell wall biosynthesis [Paenibacillus shirakamiensis]
MKIAYLIHWNEGESSGVFKKVVHQVEEWHRCGHEVGLFVFTHTDGSDWSHAIGDVQVKVQTYTSGVARLLQFRRLADQIRAWTPDVVYHRFDLYYFGLPTLLKQFPSVLEINTNDLTEMKMERRLGYLYHRWTRGYVLKAAKGVVFVSRELAHEKQFSRYVKDRKVIGNGISLRQFLRVHSSPLPSSTDLNPIEQATEQPIYAEENTTTTPIPTGPFNIISEESESTTTTLHSNANTPTIRFVFIGTPGQSWHGIDSIGALAQAKPEWYFDIIGTDAREMKGPPPSNMHFHGLLSRSEYQPLLSRADIAIGTLALYRKQMKEASPLKVREYLANGLPVITAYEDTDFPRPVPFILTLPNGPGNTRLGLERIEAFVKQWKGYKVDRSLIHHLDTRVKEEERLQYMAYIRELEVRR